MTWSSSQHLATIIDFSPYWRPAAYASAIVIADALVWEGAGRQVLDAVAHIGDFGQYLVRALIFRAVTEWIFSQEEPVSSAVEGDDSWARAVTLACQFAVLRDLQGVPQGDRVASVVEDAAGADAVGLPVAGGEPAGASAASANVCPVAGGAPAGTGAQLA